MLVVGMDTRRSLFFVADADADAVVLLFMFIVVVVVVVFGDDDMCSVLSCAFDIAGDVSEPESRRGREAVTSPLTGDSGTATTGCCSNSWGCLGTSAEDPLYISTCGFLSLPALPTIAAPAGVAKDAVDVRRAGLVDPAAPVDAV